MSTIVMFAFCRVILKDVGFYFDLLEQPVIAHFCTYSPFSSASLQVPSQVPYTRASHTLLTKPLVPLARGLVRHLWLTTLPPIAHGLVLHL